MNRLIFLTKPAWGQYPLVKNCKIINLEKQQNITIPTVFVMQFNLEMTTKKGDQVQEKNPWNKMPPNGG